VVQALILSLNGGDKRSRPLRWMEGGKEKVLIDEFREEGKNARAVENRFLDYERRGARKKRKIVLEREICGF